MRPVDRDELGQTLVEFALVLPIFMLVIFGLFDVGRAVYTNSVLSQGAREGARLAATEAGWIGATGGACVSDASQITAARPGAHVCPADVATLKANVVSAVNRMVAAVGAVTAVHISCNDGDALDPVPQDAWTEGSGGNGCRDAFGNPAGASGRVVSVRVEYDYLPFTPFISSILGSTSLSATATMEIN